MNLLTKNDMEEQQQPLEGEPKKRGRRKGQKAMPVMAIHKDTFEFFGIFPSSGQAAHVLFDNRDMGAAVSKCAKGDYLQVKGFIFGFVDISDGITTVLIKEMTEKIKQKTKKNKPYKFTKEMTEKMDEGELKALYDLYNKYKP